MRPRTSRRQRKCDDHAIMAKGADQADLPNRNRGIGNAFVTLQLSPHPRPAPSLRIKRGVHGCMASHHVGKRRSMTPDRTRPDHRSTGRPTLADQPHRLKLELKAGLPASCCGPHIGREHPSRRPPDQQPTNQPLSHLSNPAACNLFRNHSATLEQQPDLRPIIYQCRFEFYPQIGGAAIRRIPHPLAERIRTRLIPAKPIGPRRVQIATGVYSDGTWVAASISA